jgi:hypothetical protein
MLRERAGTRNQLERGGKRPPALSSIAGGLLLLPGVLGLNRSVCAARCKEAKTAKLQRPSCVQARTSLFLQGHGSLEIER